MGDEEHQVDQVSLPRQDWLSHVVVVGQVLQDCCDL